MVFLVLLGLGFFGVGAFYFYGRDPEKVRTIALARSFQERVQSFRQHADTLDEHSNEYQAVFNDNEWSVLLDTLSRLEEVNQEIQQLLKQQNYPSARANLERVMNPPHAQPPLEKIDAEIHHLEELINWEINVHSLLKRVVYNLEVAAVETRNIAKAKRPASSRPTLVTLADIKKQLLEDEELRKISEV
jgi:hypothetical protein